MPVNLPAKFVRSALGSRLRAIHHPCPEDVLTAVAVDSRQITAGALFVALPGEHVDGHQFVGDAFRRGAPAALVNRPIEVDPPRTLYEVDDTLAALQDLAAAWRQQFSTTAIGITGSVGKTTTKELVAAVLRQRFPILKSERNLNSEIGLPLTLFHLDGTQRYAVLEMGMYALGEIALLCRLARPEYGIITNVGPVHLERLGTIERIAQAKAELAEALPPGGTVYLNGDDPRVSAMAAQTRATVRRFGFGPDLDVRATEICSRGLAGTDFTVELDKTSRRLRTALAGRHLIAAALPAIGLGRQLGVDWSEIEAGLNDPTAELRLRVVAGPRGSRILDDTYNASPASMKGALDLLAELPGRRIAVLGDMRELGAVEQSAHQELGHYAAARADRLLVVGRLAPVIAEAARAAGLRETLLAPSKVAIVEQLQAELGAGDQVLVKGSRGLELETIVEAIASEVVSRE